MIARAATACLLLCAAPAAADGPALAFVTLEGRTLTLTAQNAPFQVPMIRYEDQTLHLTFADLHLGFPLPPLLDVSLRQDTEGWQVTGLRLETAQAVYMNNDAQIVEINDENLADLSLTFLTEALAPTPPFGFALVPIQVEITLRSP